MCFFFSKFYSMVEFVYAQFANFLKKFFFIPVINSFLEFLVLPKFVIIFFFTYYFYN